MKNYKLWKDNRLDQEFAVTPDELKARFDTWLNGKGIAFVNHYNSERLVRFFLTAKDGMSSTFEEDDLPGIMEDIGQCIADFEKANA